MSDKKRRQVITYALALFKQGVSANALAARLMTEFDLTRSQARDLAGAAIKQWKATVPARSEAKTSDRLKSGRDG